MSRDYKIYLQDISKAIKKIENYVKGMDKSEFIADDLKIDAIVRNLEIIGEAAKNVKEDIRKKHASVDWKKISGLRNLLIHEYFAVDLEILWDIIKHKIPELKTEINKILQEL